MRASENARFTPAEAAVLTQMSLKAVNNAIDKKTVRAVAGQRAGLKSRLLDVRALMALALERRFAGRFMPELRRDLFDALAKADSRSALQLELGIIRLDLREPRRELARALRKLRRARQAVISDPEIMGGDPVFRGTRIPVHMIAALLSQGESIAEILECYPSLTREMVELAPLYAESAPLRGPPRVQPWRSQPALEVTRRKLASIPME